MAGTYPTYREWNAGKFEARPAPYMKRAKLTAAQRQEIGYRRFEGESPMTLALEYKVSRATIDGCAKMERPYGV